MKRTVYVVGIEDRLSHTVLDRNSNVHNFRGSCFSGKFIFNKSIRIPTKLTLDTMSLAVSSVQLSADAYMVCMTHALSTEKEEIMGLLIGEVSDIRVIYNYLPPPPP